MGSVPFSDATMPGKSFTSVRIPAPVGFTDDCISDLCTWARQLLREVFVALGRAAMERTLQRCLPLR